MGTFHNVSEQVSGRVSCSVSFGIRHSRLQDFRGAKTTLPKISNVTQPLVGPGFPYRQMDQPATICFDVINRDLVFVSDLGFGGWILNRVGDS